MTGKIVVGLPESQFPLDDLISDYDYDFKVIDESYLEDKAVIDSDFEMFYQDDKQYIGFEVCEDSESMSRSEIVESIADTLERFEDSVGVEPDIMALGDN